MPRCRPIAAALALVAGGIGLAGCGSATEGTPPSVASPAGAASTAGAPAPPADPRRTTTVVPAPSTLPDPMPVRTTGVYVEPARSTVPAGTPVDWLAGSTVSTALGPCTSTVATPSGRLEVYPPTAVVLDAASGALRWQLCPPRPSIGLVTQVTGDVVVLGGVTPQGPGLAVLDRRTGAVRWQTVAEGGWTVQGTTVHVTEFGAQGTSGQLIAFDVRTGAERWRADGFTTIGVEGTPAAASPVVVARSTLDPDGGIVGLDAATGAVRWRDGSGLRGAVVGGDVVVLWGEGPYDRTPVMALDVATGAPRWDAVGAPVVVTASATLVKTVRGVRTIQVPVTTGMLATSMPGTIAPPPADPAGSTAVEISLFRIDARSNGDGRLLWSADVDGESADGPIERIGPARATGAEVVLWQARGGYQGRDAATGRVLWTRERNSEPAAVGDDLLIDYDGTGGGGRFVAVDLRTGAERWRVALPCVGLGAGGTAGCTLSDGYVQSFSLGGGAIGLALNAYNGG